MAAPKDPARTAKRTPEELLEAYRSGCRAGPCMPVREGRLKCPFCPWLSKYYLKKEGGS